MHAVVVFEPTRRMMFVYTLKHKIGSNPKTYVLLTSRVEMPSPPTHTHTVGASTREVVSAAESAHRNPPIQSVAHAVACGELQAPIPSKYADNSGDCRALRGTSKSARLDPTTASQPSKDSGRLQT